MAQPTRRICFLLPAHWGACKGGSEYQVSVILDQLISKRNYEIYYLTRYANFDSQVRDYRLIKIANANGLRRFTFVLDAPRILGFLEQVRPDVVYQRVGCAYTGIAAYYTKHYKTKMIWHIANDRDVLPGSPRFRGKFLFSYIERKILQYGIANAQMILAQTYYQSELLRKNYGRTAAAVIPNMHPLPSEATRKTGPIKIVWIGGFKHHKRPEIFLKLAEDLSGLHHSQFVMIGSAENLQPWSRHISKAQELKNLSLLGQVPQEQVNAVLAQAHVLVNTSEFEGFPNTFIQAWMRKVPVVSLNVDPDGVLAEKRIGFCSGSYDGLRRDLMRLISDPDLRNEMGERARGYAFEIHSTENMDKLLQFFDV